MSTPFNTGESTHQPGRLLEPGRTSGPGRRRAVPATLRALRTRTARGVALVSTAVLVGTLLVSAPAPAAVPIGTTGEAFTNVAVLGTNSVHLQQGSHIEGAVIVNDATPPTGPGDPPPPPTLVPGFKLAIDRTALVTGNVAADQVLLNRASAVTGQVAYNVLSNKGAVVGSLAGPPLGLPIFASLPPFEEASVRPDPGNPLEQPFNITVGSNGSQTLGPGEYGDVVVGAGGTLTFTGGDYDVRSIDAGQGSTISFTSPTDLRVERRFALGQNGQVRPATGASISAADIVIYVGGSNGGNDTANALPAAVQIGQSSVVEANLYVPRGTAWLNRSTVLTGGVIARDVKVDRDVRVTANSAYGNNAPVAIAQVVSNNTEVRIATTPVPVPITLVATDADGDALTYTLASLPTAGTLSENGTPIAGPAPVTLAGNVVDYTPTATIDQSFSDSFTFSADDGDLTSNVATVEIRGPEPDTNPQGVVGIDAKDDQIETFEETTIVLNAAAPATIGDLTFSIATPPAASAGALGPVTDIVPDPPTTPIRSASVTFTPTVGFAGAASFVFQACEVAAPGNCDTATVNITVGALAPIAPPVVGNVAVAVLENGTVELDLSLGGDQVGEPPPPGAEEGRQGFAGQGFAGQGFAGLRSAPGPVHGFASVRMAPGAMPMNTTVSDQASFLALLSSSETYDFEQSSGFPAASANIFATNGAIDGIAFDGRIGFAVSPPPPSGNQFMRGTDPCCYTGPGHVGFDEQLPNAVGFFTGFGAIGNPAPFTYIRVIGANEATLHEQWVATTGGGGTYFGFVSDTSDILGIDLVGVATSGSTAGVAQQFGIDDITVGTGSENPSVTIDSTVAWNVADSNFDQLGDESNATNPGFPGTPGLISATNNTTGGSGSNGIARVHIEWDIANLSGPVGEAEVTLHTSFGGSALDTLATKFYAATGDGDGLLTNSDWETPATEITGVELANLSGITTFTFDVTAELQAAIDAGHDWFVLQGRVLESPLSTNPGGERGMQIRSQCATCANADPPELTVTFGAAPDLVVDSLTHDPASPTTEDNINFTAVVKNVGNAAAGPSTLSFKIGGESPSSPNALFAVPSLAPGETFEVERTASLTAQNYLNTAVADFAEDVAESNETNNTTTDSYTVTEAAAPPSPFVWKVTVLPTKGTLYNSLGAPVTVGVPLPSPVVTYVAGPAATVGQIDQFTFTAGNAGGTSAPAIGFLPIVDGFVIVDPCIVVGRPLGCTPGS